MWLKKLCDDYGVSENKLAKRSGVPRTTLNSSNNAKSKSIGDIKLKNAKKIAKSLGCSVDELYNWYK